MNEVTLEVETITPLFIAGADQKNIENEGLRAPSLRGAMRWWFRCLAGHSTGNDILSIKKIEDEIFGSTNSKSKISLRVSGENVPKLIRKECYSWDKAVVWDEYVDYLFFSCLNKRKDRRSGRIKVISRPYYPEKSRFRISVCGGENEVKIALASLWALIYLGGIGFRMRRGCGCLKVSKVKGDTFGLNFICKNPNELRKFLKDNIEAALEVVGELFITKHKQLTSIPEYSVLDPNYSALFVKEASRNNWISALTEIGKWYIGQRKGKNLWVGLE